MASRTAYSTWTPQKPTLFDGHYLRKRSTLDIGVLGCIGIVQHREHSPEILSIPTSSSLSFCHFYPPFYLSFINPLWKAVSTQNVTNPVSLPFTYFMQDIPLLLDSK